MFINDQKAREQVIEAGLRMKAESLITRTYGNISARISDDEFVITPSGIPYENLKAADLVAVKIEDLSWSGEIKPSSELGVHAAIYRNRADIAFVIHTHQTYATVLSTLGEDLPAPTVTIVEPSENEGQTDTSTKDRQGAQASFGLDEGSQNMWQFFGSSVPCAEYGMNGTDKLIKAVESRVQDTPDSLAILMRNHGAICFGKDYKEAAAVVRSLEDMCRQIYGEKVGAYEDAEAYENEQAKSDVIEEMEAEEKESKKPVPPRMKDLLEEPIPEADLYRYCTVYPLPGKTAYLSALPATVLYSQRGEGILPYIDDFAMTAGIEMISVPEEAGGKEILKGLPEKNGAVFLTGHGAICAGTDEKEAKIVALLVEKNCMAGMLENPVAIMKTNARKEHKLYMDKYSKLIKTKL